jgi:hypothetical protein
MDCGAGLYDSVRRMRRLASRGGPPALAHPPRPRPFPRRRGRGWVQVMSAPCRSHASGLAAHRLPARAGLRSEARFSRSWARRSCSACARSAGAPRITHGSRETCSSDRTPEKGFDAKRSRSGCHPGSDPAVQRRQRVRIDVDETRSSFAPNLVTTSLRYEMPSSPRWPRPKVLPKRPRPSRAQPASATRSRAGRASRCGVLTDEELSAKKADLLSRMATSRSNFDRSKPPAPTPVASAVHVRHATRNASPGSLQQGPGSSVCGG